jgi:hypothetical protein
MSFRNNESDNFAIGSTYENIYYFNKKSHINSNIKNIQSLKQNVGSLKK